MELREYMALLLLTYGDRGCPATEYVLDDPHLEIDLWAAADRAGFIFTPQEEKMQRYSEATITPKGLEFIKNGT